MMKKFLISVIFAFALLGSGRAQVYVTQDGMGNQDGTSWANAYRGNDLLIWGQIVHDAATQQQDIWVAAGSYNIAVGGTITIMGQNNIRIYGGFPAGGGSWAQRNPQAHPSILDGMERALCVFVSNATGIVVDGLTITRGNNGMAVVGDYSAPSEVNLIDVRFTDCATVRYGGGLRVQRSLVYTVKCEFSHCAAETYGGGIYSSESVMKIDRCTFSDCVASNMDGGAIHAEAGEMYITACFFQHNQAGKGGAVSSKETIQQINECKFMENSAHLSGGAIHAEAGKMEITACFFQHNQAGNGGAVYSKETIQQINDCKFMENSALGLGGGALFSQGSTVTMADNTFTGNEAILYGGAIQTNIGEMEINACSFQHNQAGSGGAVYSKATLQRIVRCEFTENRALELEGGALVSSGSTVTLGGTTFTGNEAFLSGGAIYADAYGAMGIDACSFRHNLAGSGGAISSKATIHKIIRCEFTDNCALDHAGGALFSSGSAVTGKGNTFIKNLAYNLGGAVYATGSTDEHEDSHFYDNAASDGSGFFSESSSIRLCRCEFLHNGGLSAVTLPDGSHFIPSRGGAIYCRDKMSHSLIEMENLLIAHNRVSRYGGGIYNEMQEMRATNLTVVSNEAQSLGGGLCYYPNQPSSTYNIRLSNSILRENRAWGAAGPVENNVDWNFPPVVPTLPDVLTTGYCNIEGVSTGWILQLGNFDPNTIDQDPSFENPGNGNYRLCDYSVSAGAGSNAQTVGITIDLDGNPRIVGQNVDQGCYENQVNPYSLALPVEFSAGLYPNPAAAGGTFTLRVEGEASTALLYDLQGRRLMEVPVGEGDNLLQAPAAAGTYLLKLSASDGSILETRKVVVL